MKKVFFLPTSSFTAGKMILLFVFLVLGIFDLVKVCEYSEKRERTEVETTMVG